MTNGLNALAGLEPADPDLVAKRDLLRRVDTKYVIPLSAISALFPALVGQYARLGGPDLHGASYRSLYFDTESLRCFHDHRRGRRVRDKIRIRHYDDRQLSYLEVKRRRSVAHTDKSRTEIPFGQDTLDDSAARFLDAHSVLRSDSLRPVLWIAFRRIMLVGIQRNERCSFDVGLSMTSPCNSQKSNGLSQLVFVEIKQLRFDVQAPVIRTLHEAGFRPRSASKYALGMMMMSDRSTLRANRLLPDLRSLQRMCR